MNTDIDRWATLAKSSNRPSWNGRNNEIADILMEYKPYTVLDIGAGNRDLQKLIPPHIKYSAVDCIDCGFSDTFVIDFNVTDASDIKLYSHSEFAVCSGILEYINDIVPVLKFVKNNSNKSIITYVCEEDRESDKMVKLSGWTNGIKRDELIGIFNSLGFKQIGYKRYKSHSIFVLDNG